MTDVSTAIPPLRPQSRSRVANGSRLIEGVDLRTRPGRQWRDIVADVVATFDLRSESEIAAAGAYARRQLWLEDQIGKQCRGEPTDPRQAAVYDKLQQSQLREWTRAQRRRNRSGVNA